MALRYLDPTSFKLWQHDETTVDDDLIDEVLEATESFMDSAPDGLCRRIEVASASVSTSRVYRPKCGSDVLYIDDAAAIVSVVENGTTLTANTHYLTEPLNGLSPWGESWPIEQLTRLDAPWYTNGKRATVTVTARWGWPAIPTPILIAARILATDVLQQRSVRLGFAVVTDAVAASARSNPIVTQTIAKYRSARSWGIA